MRGRVYVRITKILTRHQDAGEETIDWVPWGDVGHVDIICKKAAWTLYHARHGQLESVFCQIKLD
jgi:hypothetical protein